VAGLVNDRLVDGVHDVSDGGLGAALAEMMVKSGTGCRVAGISGHAGLFGEGPSRALVSVPPARLSAVRERSSAAGVPVTDLGVGGGDALIIDGLLELSLSDALSAWRGALPALFSVR
jgi:phosphoribosylformylglycinamidine synthase